MRWLQYDSVLESQRRVRSVKSHGDVKVSLVLGGTHTLGKPLVELLLRYLELALP